MIFSVVPLIDLVVKPESISGVTNVVQNFLNFFNVNLNLFSAGLMFLFSSLFAASFKILISHYIFKIKYEFLANIISDKLNNFLSKILTFIMKLRRVK